MCSSISCLFAARGLSPEKSSAAFADTYIFRNDGPGAIWLRGGAVPWMDDSFSVAPSSVATSFIGGIVHHAKFTRRTGTALGIVRGQSLNDQGLPGKKLELLRTSLALPIFGSE